ncbi:MAG: hypothetical protein IKK48_01620 [Firmicutes bacterium]|nr:hypothetical protein [Bacillota bacterium]
MPILLLGLVFAIGLIIYYLFSEKEIEIDNDIEGVAEDDHNPFEKEENVIFLPNDIESVKEMYKKKK